MYRNSRPNLCSALVGAAVAAACTSNPPAPLPESRFTNVADTVTAIREVALTSSEQTLFTRVTRVLLGPDSNVYVLDADRTWVTVFSPAGAFVRRIGNKGSGPGEFEGPIQRIGFIGDTIWIEDWIKQRTNWFAQNGEYLKQTVDTIEIDRDRFPGAQLPLTYMRGGALYETNEPALTLSSTALGPIVMAPVSSRSVNHEDTTRFERQRDTSGRASRRLDTLALRSAWRGVVPIPNAGTLRVTGIPVPTVLAYDAFGNGVTLVTQSSTDVERQVATVSVQQWDSHGRRVLQRILGEGATTPVPTSVRDSIYAKATASLNRLITQLPEIKRTVTDPAQLIKSVLHIREFYPVVHDARTMRDGSVWLRIDDVSGLQRWLTLDAQLKPRRMVQLPVAARLEDGARGLLWVVERDSFDVMTVVAYKVP
ncbi:MAG: 6-bladed beta-propeller [Gemmatimonas sp.]